MMNEEKAREIAEYYTDINDIGVALNSAKEMAEWKDQQFKEYLEKKRQKIVSILEDITEEDARHFALYQRYVYLGIIIDELFPNTEQDNTDRDE